MSDKYKSAAAKQQKNQSGEEIELQERQPITNGDVPEGLAAEDHGAKNVDDVTDGQQQNAASDKAEEVDGDVEKADAEEEKPKLPRAQTVRKKLVGKAPLSLIDQLILDESEVQNRRLLPDTKNPLHIIDGPEYRYYLGIIDFLTLYECRQRMGRVIKSVKFCCGDHSTIPPVPYGQRFLDFIEEHTA